MDATLRKITDFSLQLRNPASDKDIGNKLTRMNNGLLSPGRVSALLEVCWRLEELDDVRELISAMRAG